MGSFDCAQSPQRTPNTSHKDGDQGSFSKDTSTFREGSVSNVTSGPLFTLLGGTQAMKYWSHNCTIDANGNFLAKDDAGSSGLLVYDENEHWQFFGAPASARGSPPVFTKYADYNFLTGAWSMGNLSVGGFTAITVFTASSMFFAGAGNTTGTGTNNYGLGQSALASLTSGSHNTAFGYVAGANFNYDDSTFVGHVAGVNATGYANVTAIGYSATGTKSNQVVLGNTSVVETLLNGKTGIGVTGPTAVLHLKAGSATAATAPLKFSSGTLMTTPEVGAVEFLTDAFYVTTTTGPNRNMLVSAKSGRSVGASAAVASVVAYTLPAVDGSFEVSANVLVTAATAHSFNVTVSYTDEGGTARVLTLNFSTLAGVISNAAITNVAGAVPYEGSPLHIRCKASTTITIATTGTFTTVAYNVEGSIRQIA